MIAVTTVLVLARRLDGRGDVGTPAKSASAAGGGSGGGNSEARAAIGEGAAMKLYVCWGTFATPRPGGHPCRNAYVALKQAGMSRRS